MVDRIGISKRRSSLRLRRGLFVFGKTKPAFAAPDAHNSHRKRVAPVNDTKRRIDDLPQIVLAEFRNDTPNVRIILQTFDACDDIGDNAGADIRCALLSIPGVNILKIGQCRLGESNFHCMD